MLKRYEQYGFTLDKDLIELDKFFEHKFFDNLHIDVYTSSPYMLLLRTIEKNVEIIRDEDRIIIRNGKINKTTIANISKKNIDECIIKRYDVNCYEIVLSLGEIFYKIFAVLMS